MNGPWQSVLNLPVKPPAVLRPWLQYTAALTPKLEQEKGEACLQILSQTWQKPTWWDKYMLGLTEQQLVFHRNILMSSGNWPCWYAKTIVPQVTYETNEVFFSRLSQESLGTMVFNTTTSKRQYLHHYAIDPACLEYYWLEQHWRDEQTLWARFSVFSIGEYPFFLVEIILPGLFRSSK